MSLTNHGAPTAPPKPGSSLTEDTLFEVLNSDRRRLLIRLLAEREAEILDVEALADAVADHEGNAPQTCYISLIQTHIPKLANADVLDYDKETKTVTNYDVETLCWMMRMAQLVTDANSRGAGR